MQLRVVADQPWTWLRTCWPSRSVGDPRFEAGLGEIDRRSGGELHALADFGELKAERYAAVIVAPGQLRRGGSWQSGRSGGRADASGRRPHRFDR